MQMKLPENILTNLLIVVLLIVVKTFILRFFWNEGLVRHITVLKPITTLYHTLLLAIGLALVKC